MLATAHIRLVGAQTNCTAQAEALCNQYPECAAFGLFGDRIQLHGCVATVPNADWQIYARNATNNSYTPLPPGVNIDETKCSQHPPMEQQCVPAPAAPLYTKQGSYEVGTFENTIFYYGDRLLVLENIACSYWGHAGQWQPEVFGNHSYARIRDLTSGVVLVNLTLTVGYGFLSAFPDYDTGVLWLFGTPSDRCQGNGDATTIYTWWSSSPGMEDSSWSRALAINYGSRTYNVQVTRVGPLPGSSIEEQQAWQERHSASVASLPASRQLPPHRFAMFIECFGFAINNNADGNLTNGWQVLNGTQPPAHAPCGGPSMRYNPLDAYYYIFTGGAQVYLYRSQDFQTWQESNPSPFISPSEEDAQVAPYTNFAARAGIVGSPPFAAVGVPEPYPSRPFEPYWEGSNWTSWVRNSNDADVCCMHANVSGISYVLWGASTQGRAPAPPLTGSDAGTNAIATAAMPLTQLLAAYFVNATQL